MLTAYIQAAMRHATYEWLPEDGIHYAAIPELPGVWTSGATREELPSMLQAALEGWIALGLSLHHSIPVIDGQAAPDSSQSAPRCDRAGLDRAHSTSSWHNAGGVGSATLIRKRGQQPVQT